MQIISREVIMNEYGQDVGTREIKNEVIDHFDHRECVTREIIRLHENRIVLEHVIHRSQWKKIE